MRGQKTQAESYQYLVYGVPEHPYLVGVLVFVLTEAYTCTAAFFNQPGYY